MFDAARTRELEVLARRGTLEVVWREDVQRATGTPGGRFLLSIKIKGTDSELYWARYLVQVLTCSHFLDDIY